jgi:hypothetical protein
MKSKVLAFLITFFCSYSSFAQIERIVNLQKFKIKISRDRYYHAGDHIVRNYIDYNSLVDEKSHKLTSAAINIRKIKDANDNANNNTGDIGGVPALTLPGAFTGNSNINYIPNINVVGGYSYITSQLDNDVKVNNKGFFSCTSNIFTSGISQFTSTKQVYTAYWTPEASIWGINFDLAAGKSLSNGKNPHTLMGRVQIDFLGKKLTAFDSLTGNNPNNASCMSVHIKAGLEYMPFNNFLVLYMNMNLITALTNVDTFRTYFALKDNDHKLNGYYPFMDFGIRVPYTILNANISSGSSANVQNGAVASTRVYVDFNIIPINGYMADLYRTSDKVIVSFKVGFVESFGINSNPQAQASNP